MNSHLLLSSTRRIPAPRPMRPTPSFRAVRLSDAAAGVMTDFEHEHPIIVSEERRIDDALEEMISLGVRALLVVREGRVTGLITSYDIQGERPMQFLDGSTYTRHDEIPVRHIMTPWEQVPVLGWEAVSEASVGDVLEVFRETKATHLLVLETAADGSAFVRGLISRTRLERQLAGYA